MKFYLDDELIFELNETQQKIMQYKWHKETFKQEMKRLVEWVITHNYEGCLSELIKDWQPKLKEKMIPVDKCELSELIFKQEGYEDMSKREPKSKRLNDRKDIYIE